MAHWALPKTSSIHCWCCTLEAASTYGYNNTYLRFSLSTVDLGVRYEHNIVICESNMRPVTQSDTNRLNRHASYPRGIPQSASCGALWWVLAYAILFAWSIMDESTWARSPEGSSWGYFKAASVPWINKNLIIYAFARFFYTSASVPIIRCRAWNHRVYEYNHHPHLWRHSKRPMSLSPGAGPG